MKIIRLMTSIVLLFLAVQSEAVTCPRSLVDHLKPGQCVCAPVKLGSLITWGVFRGRAPGVIELTSGLSQIYDLCRQVLHADHRSNFACAQELIWTSETEYCDY
ncbi:MAG: hypothetical protein ABL927_10760 [Bdellovibrionales bacterium]